MKVFITEKGLEFYRESSLYRSYLQEFFDSFEELGNEYPELNDNQEYRDYVIYHEWPIRQLEYSYCIERVKDHIGRGNTLLEAGCGVSPIPFLWKSLGAKVSAVDISGESVESMRKLEKNRRYVLEGDDIEFETANLCALPFDDESFDIVNSTSVLEHIPFPDHYIALSEMYRVLKPGGLIVCTCDLKSERTMKAGHIGAFSTEDIADLLEPYTNELDKESADYRFLSISQERIDGFWDSHRSSSSQFFEGRNYTAIGFSIIKDLDAHSKGVNPISFELLMKKSREMVGIIEKQQEELVDKEKQIAILSDAAKERLDIINRLSGVSDI